METLKNVITEHFPKAEILGKPLPYKQKEIFDEDETKGMNSGNRTGRAETQRTSCLNAPAISTVFPGNPVGGGNILFILSITHALCTSNSPEPVSKFGILKTAFIKQIAHYHK
jgi:hypothetical protein